MKTIEITKPYQIRVAELESPSCGAGEVLLRIRYVGFCGSDLNSYRGKNGMAKFPLIPGHEIGAEIVRIGENVPDTLKPGMVVTVNPYTNCGYCSSCHNRRYNACEHNETLGVQRNGAMREYLAVPWEKIIPADGISVRDSALIEPMSVGFHAVNRAQVTDTDTVMVIGCGMIGIGAIIRATVRGAKVIAVDVDNEKLSIVKNIGADVVINSKEEDLHKRLSEITNSQGPDVVIEAVGSPLTQRQAIEEVAFTGRVVFIGYSMKESSFDTSLFVKKELDVRGSRNALPEDFEGVIRYIKRGQCPCDRLISEVVKPEEALDAMKRWDAAPGKVFRILVEF
jgi:2-desacetyl-2-hydroxyethyl bacteriochlorophyllide A dehydrogenase